MFWWKIIRKIFDWEVIKNRLKYFREGENMEFVYRSRFQVGFCESLERYFIYRNGSRLYN